jgi:hypothetical protein
MKKIIASGFFIVFLLSPGVNFGAESIPDAAKRANPQYYEEYVKYSYKVSLPAGISKALNAYNPTFKILKMDDFAEELRFRLVDDFSNLSCYSAVFGDFNGDGRLDAAVLVEGNFWRKGQHGKVKYFPVLAIVSEGVVNYHILEVAGISADKPVTTSIAIARPGKVTEACGGESFEMKNDGIRRSKGNGVTVYYWDDTQKKFKEIAAGGC